MYKATCLLDRKTVALKKVQVSQQRRGLKASLQELLLCPHLVALGRPLPPSLPALPCPSVNDRN